MNISKDTIENIMNAKNYKCPVCQKAAKAGLENVGSVNWKKGIEKSKRISRKTHQEFVKEVKEKYGDEYKILGKYKNGNTKIKIKHNNCGHEFMQRPSNLLQGKGCPKCGMEQRLKTREDRLRRIEEGHRKTTYLQWLSELTEDQKRAIVHDMRKEKGGGFRPESDLWYKFYIQGRTLPDEGGSTEEGRG